MAHIGFLLIAVTQAATASPNWQPYVIQLKTETVYGFWEQKGTQSGGVVRVELDTPWLPDRQWKMISLSDVVEAVPERQSETTKRHKRGFDEAGYVLVKDSVPVPKDKYELAMRAREMAGVDKQPEQDVEAVEASAVPPAGAVTTEPAAGPPLPGFFERWGAHIGLLLVAVLLTGLVVRMAFLSGD